VRDHPYVFGQARTSLNMHRAKFGMMRSAIKWTFTI